MSEAPTGAELPGDDRDDLWADDLEDLEAVDVSEPIGVPAVVAEDADDDEPEDEDDEDDDEVDFALVAWRADGDWRVVPAEDAGTWAGFRAAVRAQAGAEVVLGFAGLDDAFLVIARVAGTGVRALLSDVEAADELDFAADLLDELRESDPALEELLDSGDLDDAEDPVAIGDAALLEDLGMTADELREVCADIDADPEDMVEEIADSLGIAAQMGRALDALDG